jgi:hypothetical protein
MARVAPMYSRPCEISGTRCKPAAASGEMSQDRASAERIKMRPGGRGS